jgi:hypothetical protein
MVRYNLEQRVFLYDTYVKYGSAGKCRRKFRRKFLDERVPSRQTILNLVNKLRTTGLSRNKKTKHKRRVLTEEKWSIWFFLLGLFEGKSYSTNPRTEGLKENFLREISNIPTENLQKVDQNLFRRCEECLRVEGQNFQHLLWFVNKGNNFPSFQMLSACWVIGKIRVRSAAGGGSVAVKRGAGNASS